MAPITTFYAALCGVLAITLALLVVRRRRSSSIGMGAGNDEELERAIRAHGNFVEYVPLALILLFLAETGGAFVWWVHAMGATLFVARVIHAWGLGQVSGRSFGRFWGTAATWLVILALSLGNLVLFFR